MVIFVSLKAHHLFTEMNVEVDNSQQFPTPSGISEAVARQACDDVIATSCTSDDDIKDAVVWACMSSIAVSYYTLYVHFRK